MSTDEQQRVLVLAPFAPRLDAAHGGGRAIAQLIVELGRRHRVALLALRPDGDRSTDDVVRNRCEIVQETRLPSAGRTRSSRWRRRVRLLAALMQGRPMWVADCAVPAFAKEVAHVVDVWRPHVVQAEFHVMGQYLLGLKDASGLRIVTQHEPGTSAVTDILRTMRVGPARLLVRLDSWAWRRYETSVLEAVDATVVFTRRDLQELRRLAPRARIACISLGAHMPADLPRDVQRSEPETLLFIGNFMHPPNVDAARRLVDRIMPLVLREAPDAKLFVVGDRVPDSLRADRRQDVILTGWVDDLRPYLAAAAVVVAPIRFGGGQRLKVIDALVAGKALVATRRAIEGFELEDGREVLVAETDEEFAAAILHLLVNGDQRDAMGANARAWAEENLTWESTIDAYDRLYSEVFRERRRLAR